MNSSNELSLSPSIEVSNLTPREISTVSSSILEDDGGITVQDQVNATNDLMSTNTPPLEPTAFLPQLQQQSIRNLSQQSTIQRLPQVQ
jgi:uncharacterized membrane protein YcaP (DUF421 family)